MRYFLPSNGSGQPIVRGQLMRQHPEEIADASAGEKAEDSQRAEPI